MVCRFLTQTPAEGVHGEHAGHVSLCAWAEAGAPAALLNVPRWLQREALGGHLWHDGDCDGCPCADPL